MSDWEKPFDEAYDKLISQIWKWAYESFNPARTWQLWNMKKRCAQDTKRLTEILNAYSKVLVAFTADAIKMAGVKDSQEWGRR